MTRGLCWSQQCPVDIAIDFVKTMWQADKVTRWLLDKVTKWQGDKETMRLDKHTWRQALCLCCNFQALVGSVERASSRSGKNDFDFLILILAFFLGGIYPHVIFWSWQRKFQQLVSGVGINTTQSMYCRCCSDTIIMVIILIVIIITRPEHPTGLAGGIRWAWIEF